MAEETVVKEKAEKPVKLCRTGSGRQCKGTYAPGGDAQYKSALIEKAVSGKDHSDEDKKSRRRHLANLGYGDDHIENWDSVMVTPKRAEAIIDELNWGNFLTRKRQIVEERTAKQEAATKAKAEAKAEKEAAKAANKSGAERSEEAADKVAAAKKEAKAKAS